MPGWQYKELLYETVDNGKIAIMTMNRPERMNSSDPMMAKRWYDAWTHYAADDDCWVAIVTGAGDRAFSAGQDLRVRDERETAAGAGQAPAEVVRVPHVLPLGPRLGCWKPTIAAVNGYAIAGGFSVAQMCTFCIAVEHAEFNIAEARWNQSGASFAGWLPRLMHTRHVLEICLLADRRVSAQRAYEMGLVNKVVPKEQLMDEAVDWARTIINMAPRSIRNLNEAVFSCWNMSIPEAQTFAEARAYNLRGMEDAKEGPRAFAEKRRPVFKDR